MLSSSFNSYHETEHAIFIQSNGFLTASRNTVAYCIFLPFSTADSGSKFWTNQLFITELPLGMTKGIGLSKRKRNVLRRDDYFYFHHYSFQICIIWPSVKSIRLDMWPNFFFCILLDFLKVVFFCPSWLCHETSSLARCATSWIEARFAHF